MLKVKKIIGVGLLSICLATVSQVGFVAKDTQVVQAATQKGEIIKRCYAYSRPDNSKKITSREGCYWEVRKGQKVEIIKKSGKFYKVKYVKADPGNCAESEWLENVYIPRACIDLY
ncbi:hypothetical protein [Anaeromicropila populeti]|uniref:SH3 domain-containing protein n=1 Tax=Anaeromicropila populeti TaxID=37658 RepID=A0A1I6I743_9FIRM|nr:hypothetical protein [Anaeromicropila populeti]SFR62474.1 hypothetical protein SAMN05661086_00492 [Anaeromicropila populeti]